MKLQISFFILPPDSKTPGQCRVPRRGGTRFCFPTNILCVAPTAPQSACAAPPFTLASCEAWDSILSSRPRFIAGGRWKRGPQPWTSVQGEQSELALEVKKIGTLFKPLCLPRLLRFGKLAASHFLA